MNFDSLIKIVEDTQQNIILIVEDNDFRMKMMLAWAKELLPSYTLIVKDNNYDAAQYLLHYGDKVVGISLDYNLKMETSEGIASYIKKYFPDIPIVIHSDDTTGHQILKGILPDAKISAPPTNIKTLKELIILQQAK